MGRLYPLRLARIQMVGANIMTEYNTHLYFQVPKEDLNKTMEIDFISINAMNISLIAVCERSPAEKNLHSHLRIVTDTNRSFVFDLHIRAALLQKILSRYI